MPGQTLNYGLPYMLGSEALHTIDDVTKLLAERLDTLMTNGTLKGAKGDPGPKGDPGSPGTPGAPGPAGDLKPTAIATCAAFTVNQWTETSPASWSSLVDVNNGGTAQVTSSGLVCRVAGVYLLTLQMPWSDPPANTITFAKIKVNGTTRGEDIRTAAGYEHVSSIAFPIRLAVGDTVRAVVVHNNTAQRTAGGTIQGGVDARLGMYLWAT